MPACLSNSNMTLAYTGFMQVVSVPMEYVEQELAVRLRLRLKQRPCARRKVRAPFPPAFPLARGRLQH